MVSPLQVAMAYAAIANDGVRMRPRLVDGIYVDDKNSNLRHLWKSAES